MFSNVKLHFYIPFHESISFLRDHFSDQPQSKPVLNRLSKSIRNKRSTESDEAETSVHESESSVLKDEDTIEEHKGTSEILEGTTDKGEDRKRVKR